MAVALADVLPPDLLTGLDALKYLPELRLNRPHRKAPNGKGWLLPVTVEHAEQTDLVPAVTQWMIHVEPGYPAGSLNIYPALTGGITATFPHQRANDPLPHIGIRSGNVCLTQEGSALPFLGGSTEPHTAYGRLHWHAERLSEWIHHARAGTLLQNGDHFEHPDVRPSTHLAVAYHERPDDLPTWLARAGQHGTVTCHGLNSHLKTLYVTQFAQDGVTMHQVEWGHQVQGAPVEMAGLWIMLSAPPVTAPWGYPRTWGELRVSLKAQGVLLDSVLMQNVEAIRDGSPHLLLLGAPLPALMGGPLVRTHWQGILLPTLAQKRTARGFRPSPEGRWRYDRQNALADHQTLTVYDSTNHHPAELGSRGLRPERQRALRAVIIGAGALGAPLAEHLARTGMTHLTILDHDTVKHGNLVRHPATLNDIGHFKASVLATRLNAASPHITATAHNNAFPHSSHLGCLRAADIIIDTTGSDTVIQRLAEQRFSQRPVILSVSLGWQGKTLYAYAQRTRRFDAPAFYKAVLPHVESDRPADHLQNTPREGIGCWHPVFPATYTDVQLMASCAASFLEHQLTLEEPGGFSVYEQYEDAGRWAGVRLRP